MENQPNVPDFTKEYFNARKQYGLFSALLLAWELIGIDVPDAPMESLKITFKSPQAVPYVLIALVFYFAYRFIVEWFQSNPKKRELRVSRVDFWVAHWIAIVALAIVVIQLVSKTQIANNQSEGFLVLNMCLTFGTSMMVVQYIEFKFHITAKLKIISAPGIIFVVGASVVSVYLSNNIDLARFAWVETGCFSIGCIYTLFNRQFRIEGTRKQF